MSTVKKRAALPVSEHALQVMVCEYMTLAIKPELYWSAIPNGGKRNLSVVVKLKCEGLKLRPIAQTKQRHAFPDGSKSPVSWN